MTANTAIPQTISLIGMPGAGKSTVGVILAKLTGLRFVDTDLDIQVRENATLQQILEQHGYLHLRAIEQEVLLGITLDHAVISTGGTRTLDGGRVRLPGRGWFVAPTGVNMENNGAVPDVLVAQPPAEDRSATEDTQLRRAVEVLLADLETDGRTGSW